MAQLDELDTIIRHKKGVVIAFIPQAGLYARAETLSAAVDLLEQQRKDLKAALQAADAPDEFETAGRSSTFVASVPRDLGFFALKAFIIIAMTIFALEYARTRMEVLIQRAPTKVELELTRQADPNKDIPEAEKQRLLANIRVVVARWRPFVAEAMKLFAAADDAQKKQ